MVRKGIAEGLKLRFQLIIAGALGGLIGKKGLALPT
jgi:hypothetical protein